MSSRDHKGNNHSSNLSKVAVVGTKKDAQKILSILASACILHPEKSTILDKDFETDKMNDIADRIVKLKNFEELMRPFFKGKIKQEKILPLNKLKTVSDSLIQDITENIVEHLENERDLVKKIESLKQDLISISKFNHELDLSILQSKRISMAAGKLPTDTVSKLKEKLKLELPEHIFVDGHWDEGWRYVIVGVMQERGTFLRELLSEFKWASINVPVASGKVSEISDAINVEMVRHQKALKACRKIIQSSVRIVYPKIVTISEMLGNYYRVIELSNYAKETQYTFLVEGWIAKSRRKELEGLLKPISGTVIEDVDFELNDVPTFVENSKVVKPYYSIVSLMGPPQQGKFNPTPTVALTFPLFFGMMLGDIGYGTLITLIALFFGKSVNNVFSSLLGENFSDFRKVLLISGITSIIFGFLFGEVFGNLAHGLIHPILFDRLEGAMPLMVASAVIGIIHMNFGFLMKMIDEMRPNTLRGLLGVGSWFLLQISVLLFFVNVGLAFGLMALSIFLMAKFEGFIGILEIPSFIGNIFSYMRLTAIGLGSAGIAFAVNTIANLLGPVWGVVVLIFGHILNLFLGILDPFIQSTRLHLVEFFGKFYVPARREFTPFSIKKENIGGEMKW